MKATYKQFCPVAKAAEIIAERWTPLVIRELLAGSNRFNELRRGVPLMPPSTLSQRLKRLEEEGIVERRSDAHGTRYELTAAGRELMPVIESLGSWGKRWIRRRPDERDDLDAGLLMWDIHRRLNVDCFPPNRTVLKFHLTDMPPKMRFYWLVIHRGKVDICVRDPGFEVDLTVAVDLKTMTGVWLGDILIKRAISSGHMKLHGSKELARQFKHWLKLSVFADIEREAS